LVYACMLVRTKGGTFKEVLSEIEKLRETQRAYSALGRWDIVVLFRVSDLEQLASLVEKVNQLAPVRDSETLIEIVRES